MAGDGEAREPRRAHVTRPTHRKEPKRERACVWMFNALVLSLSPFPIPPRHILVAPFTAPFASLTYLTRLPPSLSFEQPPSHPSWTHTHSVASIGSRRR